MKRVGPFIEPLKLLEIGPRRTLYSTIAVVVVVVVVVAVVAGYRVT